MGVDIFFTLSGFLITSLLISELHARGWLRFARFYQHRARRLLPALFLVLIITALLATWLAQDAAALIGGDALAALAYVANWWYIGQGVSYFDATGRPPLLEHLWSLSVEEQFYLLWPMLLYGLWRLGGIRGIRIGAIVGAVASTLAMGIIAVRSGMPESADAGRVYFGTDTHAMTLLVGAALAAGWSPARRAGALTALRRRVVTAVGTVAIGALFATLWLTDPTSNWLFRGGFLVVAVVTAVVVWAAATSRSMFSRALSVAPLRYLGERSYGLYLWHWPIFMVLRPGVDLEVEGWPVQVLRLAITFAAAELSYRYLEMPIRRGILGRAWKRWRAAGAAATIGRAAIAVVTTCGVLVALGFGLGFGASQESTVEQALNGVTAVGDDPLTPGPSAEPTLAPSASPTPSRSQSGSPSAKPSTKPTANPTTNPTGNTFGLHVPVVVPAGADAFALPATAIGDSVMLAARAALTDLFAMVTVDAQISRQPIVIYDRIRLRKKYGVLGDVVIIHAGTNGVIHEEDLFALLNALKDRSRVVLVTCRAPRGWIAESNRVILAAAKAFAGGNVRLADWTTYSAKHGIRDWFYNDGIHTRPAGSAAYAAMIREALRR